jgi:uncharacterized membrane protein YdjX (TVP38/TMEM64 family)
LNTEDLHDGKYRRPGRLAKPSLVLILAVLVSVFFIKQDLSSFFGVIRAHRLSGIGISLLVYALLGATPVPSEPLTLFLTAVYGPVEAVLIATTGNTFAALLEFLIGDNLGDLAGFENRKQHLPFGLSKLPINSPAFLLLGRMLPGFGSKFVSLAGGMYKVPLFTFTWTAVVSNLLGAALIAFSAFGLLNVLPFSIP